MIVSTSLFKRLMLILMLCSLWASQQLMPQDEPQAATDTAQATVVATEAEKDDEEKDVEEDTWSKLEPGTEVKDFRCDFITAGQDVWALDGTNKKVYQHTDDEWKEVVSKDALWVSAGKDAVALLNTSGKLFLWNDATDKFDEATGAPKLDKVFVGDKNTMMGVADGKDGLEVWMLEKGSWRRAQRKSDNKELLGFADMSVMPDGSFVSIGKDGSVYLPHKMIKEKKKKKKKLVRKKAKPKKKRAPSKKKAMKLKKKAAKGRVVYVPKTRAEAARLGKEALTSSKPPTRRVSAGDLQKAVEARDKAKKAEREAKKAARLAKKAAKEAEKVVAAAPATTEIPAMTTPEPAPTTPAAPVATTPPAEVTTAPAAPAEKPAETPAAPTMPAA